MIHILKIPKNIIKINIMDELNNNKNLKEEILSLEEDKKKLEYKLNGIIKNIIQLQSTCNHKDENGDDMTIYHSTNLTDDFYKCSICGSYVTK